MARLRHQIAWQALGGQALQMAKLTSVFGLAGFVVLILAGP